MSTPQPASFKIQLLSGVFIKGKFYGKGKVLNISASLGRELISSKRAKIAHEEDTISNKTPVPSKAEAEVFAQEEPVNKKDKK